MTILWRPSMAIGDEAIDADHQHLVELINTVELTLQGASGAAPLAATMDQLMRYAKEHFEREETLMRIIGYKGLAEHRQAHRKLRDSLGELRTGIEAAQTQPPAPQELARLVALLRSWLLDHVLQQDMLYKPALHGRG